MLGDKVSRRPFSEDVLGIGPGYRSLGRVRVPAIRLGHCSGQFGKSRSCKLLPEAVGIEIRQARRLERLLEDGPDRTGALGRDVTEGYVQISVDRLREPAQRVAARLMELCRVAPPEGANVARLRG